jgi:hypothetical protein
MGGRARPEDMRGSVEPETREAAVAAVATLNIKKMGTISPWKRIGVRKIPE